MLETPHQIPSLFWMHSGPSPSRPTLTRLGSALLSGSCPRRTGRRRRYAAGLLSGSSKPQSALIASADAALNDLCGRSRRSELECLIDSFGMHSADGPRCRCSHVSVGTTQLASASASAARLATYCRIVCVASRKREWLSRMIIIELLNA